MLNAWHTARLLAALACRPPLPLLGEPSSGLDPVVRRDILAAIIRTVADEAAMLHHGRLVFQDGMDAIKALHRRVVRPLRRSSWLRISANGMVRTRGAPQLAGSRWPVTSFRGSCWLHNAATQPRRGVRT